MPPIHPGVTLSEDFLKPLGLTPSRLTLRDGPTAIHWDLLSPRKWFARDGWPEGLRQRITRTGLAYAATLLLVALAAMLSANNLLFLVLAAMISTLLVSGFVSRLGLAGLELDLVLPEHISARRKVRAGIRLKNLKPWIPSFSVHLAGAAESGFSSILYFPVIPGGAKLEESVDLYFPTRGKQ